MNSEILEFDAQEYYFLNQIISGLENMDWEYMHSS